MLRSNTPYFLLSRGQVDRLKSDRVSNSIAFYSGIDRTSGIGALCFAVTHPTFYLSIREDLSSDRSQIQSGVVLNESIASYGCYLKSSLYLTLSYGHCILYFSFL
jgi:hypothetical protein